LLAGPGEARQYEDTGEEAGSPGEKKGAQNRRGKESRPLKNNLPSDRKAGEGGN